MNKLAFDSYGTFRINKWYYLKYGVYPNKLKYIPSTLLDTDKLSKNVISSCFKSISFYKEGFLYAENENKEKTLEKAVDHIYVDSDGIVYDICEDLMNVYYGPILEHNDVYNIARTFWDKLPKKAKEAKPATVKFVDISNGEYYTTEEDIKPFTINIEENYNDDFLPIWEDIINFITTPGSGLILMSGSWGTGKSSLIKHLITNYPKDYVIIPNGIACRLGEPELNSFIRSCKNSVFILEDCEQILSDRKNNPFNSGIANILNMSDGIASDTFNIKFICTFNAELQDIDPALTRKGRCFANYVFKELDEDKVRMLNEKYDLNLPEVKALSLADIYHAKQRTMNKINKPNKIGF